MLDFHSTACSDNISMCTIDCKTSVCSGALILKKHGYMLGIVF